TGPLARSQTLTDVESTVRYLELLKSIGGQELLTAIAKVEDLHRLAPMMAVPSWVNREAVDRDKLLDAMGEAAAQGAGMPAPEAPQGGQPQLSLVA
ncbi:hypothetical protein, partial [Pseudomonas syringae]|uniref:hypothetical protein n=1 Tax=Pseudomonas syringae TaxID=317 RepID=UPI000AD7BFBB